MGLTRIRAQQITDIDYKQAVRVVTTENVTLVAGASSGAPNQVDGVNLSTGNRILVNGQTNKAQNGLYQVQTVGAGNSGTWIRTSDANNNGEIDPGMLVMVTEGQEYADTLWKLITNGEIIIGETELTFELNTQFGFGNVSANGTGVVATVQNDTLSLTAGENITIVGNAVSKTIEFSAVGGTPGGNTTEVQYNNAGSFAGSSNFTFDGSNVAVLGNVTANYFLGNGSQLSGIITSVANINNGTSNVAINSANANVTVGVNGTGNVAVFAASGVTVAGNILPSANVTYDLGSSDSRWKDLWLANSTIYLGEAVLSANGNVLLVNQQAVITSASANSLTLLGNISGGNLISAGVVSGTTGTFTAVSGNGAALSSLAGANVTGTVANATYATSAGAATTAGTVTTAAQPNITSVGTLTSLAVTGNITSGNVSGTTGAFTTVTGNGSALTSLSASNIDTGTLAQARLANAAATLGSTALTLGATVTTVAGLSSMTSTTFVGALTGAATTAGTVTTAAQANITSVGTLTSLAVTGNITSGNVSGTTVTGTNVVGGNITVSSDLISSTNNTITIDPAAAGVTGLVVVAGNLQVTGTTTTIDSTVVTINDLAINVANNAATASAANDGGLKVGPVGSEYATWLYNQAGNVWSTGLGITATGNVSGGNVSGTTGAFTTVTGNGAALTAIDANNISTGTLAQARLANAAVTLGSTALTLGATVTTVAGLSSVTSTTFVGALTGAATSATTAGTVTTAAQPNITSVGTLSSVTVTGNVTGGNLNTAGNVSAAFFKGDGSLLTGLSSGGIEWTTSATAPVGPNPGDFWYDTDDDKTYQYVNDGVGNAWVDQSAPTSFGNLTVGNILTGGANGSGNVGSSTGYYNTVFATNGTFVNLSGNGAALTAINASNIASGTLAQARLANAAVTLGNTSLTLGATVTTVAGLSSVTSTTFVGALTGAATTAGTVTTAAQPNITSVGTMSTATITTLTTAGITKSGTNGVGNIGQSDNAFNTVFAKATSAQYADLAENYLADRCYESGTVVIFGGDAEVSVSPVSHDPRVAGVVSTNPSYLMNATLIGPTVAAVALTGRVPCWVQGPVSKGDRIVNAGTGIGGRLDRSAYEPGCIVGKSLEDITDNSTRLIEVVIGRF